VEVTRFSGSDVFRKWSPDGFRIAFRSGNQVHIMNADGMDNRALTSLRGVCVTYYWTAFDINTGFNIVTAKK